MPSADEGLTAVAGDGDGAVVGGEGGGKTAVAGDGDGVVVAADADAEAEGGRTAVAGDGGGVVVAEDVDVAAVAGDTGGVVIPAGRGRCAVVAFDRCLVIRPPVAVAKLLSPLAIATEPCPSEVAGGGAFLHPHHTVGRHAHILSVALTVRRRRIVAARQMLPTASRPAPPRCPARPLTRRRARCCWHYSSLLLRVRPLLTPPCSSHRTFQRLDAEA